MKNLQHYLFIAGFTLFAVCMIVLYGHTEYWYHLSYEESMLIPAGCFVSSALFVASVVGKAGSP